MEGQKNKEVYNYFFAETNQATTHQRDVILNAVGKVGRGLLQEAFRGYSPFCPSRF